MNIAMVSFGHVDVVLPLVKNLKSNGVDIDLFLCFSLNRKRESILDFTNIDVNAGLQPGNKVKEILMDEVKNYYTNISFIQIFMFHNLKLRSFRNFILVFKLKNKLKKYDIIHFNGTMAVLPLLTFFLRKKKLVFTIHDLYSHTGERTRYNFSEKLNRYMIKSKHPVILHNLRDYASMCKKYPGKKEKIRYIPFGALDVYREFNKSDIQTAISDVLFFGRISPYKGIKYLISALKILKQKGLNIHTIIAGEGYLPFEPRTLKELNIHFINRYIKTEELVALINNTKLIVCPYTDATQSGVAMTAFAFNKPVIASEVGSFMDVIKNGINGFLVPPREPEKLAEKIEYVISAPGMLEKLQNVANYKSPSGIFSWSCISKNTESLYRTLLSSK